MKYKSDDSPFKINEYLEYIDQVKDPKEKEWLKKFYKEYYMTDFYRDPENNIIQDPEMKSEAHRVHNSLNRDALHMGYKEHTMDNVDDYDHEFMEDASDEWEITDMYEEHGYEFTMRHIMNDTEEKLENKYLDKHLLLAKFFVKMNKLRKLYIKRGRKK